MVLLGVDAHTDCAPVVEPPDLPDIASFLAEHSPRSHAFPGDPDVRGWAGARDADGLTCVGAVVESRAGFPHLRAITTRTPPTM